MNDVDLAIVGLGTVGAMAALHATQRGALTVEGFDTFPAAHGRGGYAGESRVFRTAYHEGADYVPLLLRAREQWLTLQQRSGREIFLPTGTLSIGGSGTLQMQNVLASVREHGLPHRVLDAQALAQQFPQHATGPTDIGVLDELGGGLRSEVAVSAALMEAERHGLRIRQRAHVQSVEQTGDGVDIVTSAGTVRAGHAIVSAGSWTSRLFPQIEHLLLLKPIVLTWFLAQHIERFQADLFPTFIRDTDDFHIFGVPSLDGYSLKVSVDERWGTIGDVSELPHQMSDEALSFVGPRVRELLPDLLPEPVRHSVHVDAFTPDDHALIGPLPGSDRIVVVAGLSGHGFKLSPVFGEAAVDIALGTPPSADFSRFLPGRFDGHHAGPGR